jgi:hypothetical protein
VSEAQEEVSQNATEAAQTPEQTQMPEQTTEAAGTQEVSRRMSRKVTLEVRRFPTQEIPQELPYRWSEEDLTHYLLEDLSYQ